MTGRVVQLHLLRIVKRPTLRMQLLFLRTIFVTPFCLSLMMNSLHMTFGLLRLEHLTLITQA